MGRLIWLLPPLLGLLAFGVFRSLGGPRPAAEAAVAAVDPEPRPSTGRRDVPGLLEEFEAEWSTIERSDKLAILGLDTAALRARLLELKKKFDTLPADTGWDVRLRMIESMKAMARELGKRQQGEALEWILEAMPDLRIAAMAGWAESGPDSALEAVIASERSMPCDTATLIEMLQHQADRGAAELLDACRRVPWDLFFYGDNRSFGISDPFGQIMELPEGADVAPWVESGALVEMATEGVLIHNVFAAWAAQDPAAALARWETMPDLHPLTPCRRVAQILHPGTESPAKLEAIHRALQNLSPE
jgi:hypothetical protein